MHHRGGGVAIDLRAGTRAIFAAQRAVDIVPARVVAAHVAAKRIEHHHAARIGDGHAVIHRVLAKAPYPCLGVALLGPGHVAREAAIGKRAGSQLATGDFCQHIGRIHQRGFHRLAHPRLDLVDEHAHHEERGQAHDQEEAQKQLETKPHVSPRPRSVHQGSAGACLHFQRVAKATVGADRVDRHAGQAQLAAQRLDVGVDGAVGTVGAGVPAAVHQLRTAQDRTRALQQRCQQCVFVACQRQQGLAVADAAALAVDRKRAVRLPAQFGRRARMASAQARTRATSSRGENGLAM